MDFEFLKFIETEIKCYQEIKNESSIENKDSDDNDVFVEHLLKYIKALKQIIDKSNDSIFVSDHSGKTMIANKAFEKITGISSSVVIGKSSEYLLAEGIIRPSVIQLVLQDQKAVSIIQSSAAGNESLVNAVPIFTENGKLNMVVSNAQLVDDIRDLNQYIESKQTEKQHDLHFYVSSHPIIQNIMVLIDLVKDTDTTLLISGETGVGKSVLAEYIHDKSIRSNQNLIKINCASMPEYLIESELFGYESSFSSEQHISAKKGLVEEADGGTLCLEEIEALPLQLQSKLVQLIQEKKISRIGVRAEKEVDVRVIATTQKQLLTLVEERKFRSDLYYALSVVPIQLPALNERKSEFEGLLHFFIQKYAEKYHKNVASTDGFINALKQYYWPGNIRELNHYIEGKIITNRSGLLITKDAQDITGDICVRGENQSDMIDEHEQKERINQYDDILELYDRLKSTYKVSEVLGISQSTVYRKIKKAKSENS